MKNQAKISMLGLLLIPFAAPTMLDDAFAATVTVDQCPGAANATNDCFFVPDEVTINVGDTVIWTNSDSATHTVTSGDVNDPNTWSEAFDSGLAKPDAIFEYTFDTAGEYPYLCQLHPWMIGKVIVDGQPPDGSETVRVEFEGNAFDVEASLSNGSIESIIVDEDFASVIVTVETSATDDGKLMITLPRELIDSKMNGGDDDYIILVDGEESDYQEETTPDERALTIDVFSATEEVEIIGTQVIPEFPIAVMAVVGVIFATAIVMSRVKNPLMP